MLKHEMVECDTNKVFYAKKLLESNGYKVTKITKADIIGQAGKPNDR